MKSDQITRVRFDFKAPPKSETPEPRRDWSRIVFWMIALALLLAVMC